MKNLIDSNFEYKKILLRADLNVPVVDGKITDISRIVAIKKTIKYLQQKNNKIFLISHFGRPDGKRIEKYSLNFICPTLEKELKINKIYFLDKVESIYIQKIADDMSPKDICLFENIRFYEGEEKNDLNFIKNICANFDIYINDAFSASHRIHASIVGPPKFLPSFGGFNLFNEIKNIDNFISNPKKPKLAIIGGSKISTKIDLLYNLIKTTDTVVIGGAMANTFLYSQGIDIKNSIFEKSLSNTANSILKIANDYNCKIILPIDVVCADNLISKSSIVECNVREISENQMILDLGIKTVKLITNTILHSNMILWNGPLGAFEHKPFEKSSIKIAQFIQKYSKLKTISTIAGGGDTISAIKMANAEEGFSYISNAGGAFLEWLQGKGSPGVDSLKKN